MKRSLRISQINWETVNKILLLRLRRLGDVVLMTPCIRAVKEWKPKAHLSVLVERPLNDLLREHPDIDELIVTERKGLLRGGQLLLKVLPQKRFDLVINLHGGPRSAAQTLATRAPYRVGHRYFRNQWVYNVKVPLPEEVIKLNRPLHTVENQLSLLCALGIPPGMAELKVPVRQEAALTLETKLRQIGVGNHEPFVVIRPGATHKIKQWSPEQFAKLADWISRHYACKVVIDIGPSEKELIKSFSFLTSSDLFILERLSLSELVALIEKACLFIGNDAGPTHIAAAFKKDTIVIFGGSNPLHWAPWQTNAILLRHELPCSPCNARRCQIIDQYLCLRSVSLEEVINATTKLLEGQGVRKRK